MAVQTRPPIWWRNCLVSGFRTALACSIVGVVTLFGPEALNRPIAFPAFSYVTVILILTGATLGDALRGCWYALYATCQSVSPAILSLWLVGPARFTSASTAAAAVAISAFILVLPENRTHLIAKRISLGQTVIIYTVAYINGAKTEPVMHPVRVAASTAIGVAASVLAMLFPYPSLACCEVKHNCELFAENVSRRLNLLVKAFCAEDNASALSLVTQAKSLTASGAKLLQTIKSKQESMQWERYPIKFFRPYCKNPGERLQEYETPLRGMAMALADNNPPHFPITVLTSEVKDSLDSLTHHISNQVKGMPFDLATVPESNAENSAKFLQKLQPVTLQDLSSYFFLFCLKLVLNKPFSPAPIKDGSNNNKESSKEQGGWSWNKIYNDLVGHVSNRRFVVACKCSLSLGLAVFFGSIYSKTNGFWAGLPVAISYVSGREATFKVANVKAQGTVLGSIYGVLGCFVFEKYVQIRFVSLIPWFIVCSFLRRSRMYGQAGGLSACVGAVLILGRTGYGPPSEFAMARITETFIGLSCSILVEILFRPTRASTLAKTQLSKSLQLLNECIVSISTISRSSTVEATQKDLKVHVTQLGKFIGEADVEPNFWFLPFRSACYRKLMGSMSKVVEYLHFVAQALRFLEQESTENNLLKESLSKLDSDHLSLLRDYVAPSIKCLEEVISFVGPISVLDKELEKKKASVDPELGKLPTRKNIMGLSDGEIENKLKSFVEDSRLLQFVVDDDEEDVVMKSHVALSLSALAFCMRGIVRETREIDKAIKEIVQWENPNTPVNLHEISCKIRALAHTVTK